MLTLAEELRQAHDELRTWAALHRTRDDSDLNVWRALVTIEKAIDALERQEAILARARFVAEHWRDAMMGGSAETRWAAHPLAMVLGALDGETDPALCGIGASARAAWPR